MHGLNNTGSETIVVAQNLREERHIGAMLVTPFPPIIYYLL
jgi:hypothetical protein